MHKDEKGEIRGGQVIAAALIEGFKGSAPTMQSAAPAPDAVPDQGVAAAALQVLASAGLSKKQIEALRAAGIAVPNEVGNAEVSQ